MVFVGVVVPKTWNQLEASFKVHLGFPGLPDIPNAASFPRAMQAGP